MKTKKAQELNITVAELDTWFKSLRTMFGKLAKTVSGQGAPKYTERQKWVLDRLSFLKDHLIVKSSITLGGPPSSSQLCISQQQASDFEQDDDEHDPAAAEETPSNSQVHISSGTVQNITCTEL